MSQLRFLFDLFFWQDVTQLMTGFEGGSKVTNMAFQEFLQNFKWTDCNETRTHNHLIHTRTLNYCQNWLSVCLPAKWLWVWVLLQTLNIAPVQSKCFDTQSTRVYIHSKHVCNMKKKPKKKHSLKVNIVQSYHCSTPLICPTVDIRLRAPPSPTYFFRNHF